VRLGCSNSEGLFAQREREKRGGFSTLDMAVGETVPWGVERRPNNKWV